MCRTEMSIYWRVLGSGDVLQVFVQLLLVWKLSSLKNPTRYRAGRITMFGLQRDGIWSRDCSVLEA